MNNFYTNVQVWGNSILYRGYNEGKYELLNIKNYNPTLYVNGKGHSKYKTVHGETVFETNPGNIKECKQFIETYKDVVGFDIHGNTYWQYQYITESFPNDIEYDINKIKIVFLDIETQSENGFASSDSTLEEINVITIVCQDKRYVFGVGDFSINLPNTVCKQYDNERDMLVEFVDFWDNLKPDVITGWYVRSFDIPYIINRVTKILGEKEAKRISPWGILRPESINIRGKDTNTYKILGISILDYYELYRKYTYETLESYSLNYVCAYELNKQKVDYSEYSGIREFYIKDFQKFVEYNIQDVDLVKELDDKKNLLDLHISIAYAAKINYDDAFSQVRTWDTLIYNYLHEKQIVIPQKKITDKTEQYAGAYVKDPIIGFHDWVVSFDLASLYPHLIMQYNVSPDTIVDNPTVSLPSFTVDDLLNKSVNIQPVKDANYSMAANGQMFRKDKHGFLPELMNKFYNERKAAKKKSLEYKKKLEDATSESEKSEYKKLIAKYDTKQMALKIMLNSAYGAVGNNYFRFYDIRQAEAITLSGQLSIRWIQKCLNIFLNKLLNTIDVDYTIASDTDSVYLNLSGVMKTCKHTDKNKQVDFLNKFCEEILQPFINKKYKELAEYMNAYEQKMEMKREVIADRGLWTAKKRYCLNVYDSEGIRYHEPKLKIMGIEVQRSSTPKICREKLKEAIKLILTKSESDLIEFTENFKNYFITLQPEEVAFPRGVNGMKEYNDSNTIFKKGTPIHTKGALLYNHYIIDNKLDKKYNLIGDGDKIKFLYLKYPNPLKEKVISFPSKLPPELDLHKYVDYNLQFEKVFLDPLDNIVKAIGWSFQPKSSLEGIFG